MQLMHVSSSVGANLRMDLINASKASPPGDPSQKEIIRIGFIGFKLRRQEMRFCIPLAYTPSSKEVGLRLGEVMKKMKQLRENADAQGRRENGVKGGYFGKKKKKQGSSERTNMTVNASVLLTDHSRSFLPCFLFTDHSSHVFFLPFVPLMFSPYRSFLSPIFLLPFHIFSNWLFR
jgi:hypothetical protein